jgi:hypothetical protein
MGVGGALALADAPQGASVYACPMRRIAHRAGVLAFGLSLLASSALAAPKLSSVADRAPPVSKAAFGAVKVTVVTGAIVAQSLQAASVLYAASQLEEMKLFEVADRVADAFASGQLPVGSGARQLAQKYLESRPERLDAAQRRRLYAHVLGEPGGGGGAVAPNTEFSPLLAELLASFADFERRLAAGKGSGKPVSADPVQLAARALAQNLTARTPGAPLAASALLGQQIRDIEALLSHPQSLAAYQVKDVWQLAQKVAKHELGASVNVSRARSAALSGAAVIAWLGSVAAPLASSGGAPEVAASLTRSDVPGSARELSRIVSPKKKPASVAKALEIHAVCFDAKRQLVTCQVTKK